MFGLIQTALDFDVIEDELAQQIDLLGQELFVSYVNEALFDLEEQHNITTPLTETVSEITERVYRELEEALRSLEAKGVIMVDDQQITKESTTL